ncbi:hypothetical protein CF66_2162 [Candidatus Photodesmus katoptron]|uniref:UPF0229 protein O1U_0255 n=1 Tax=Candidatus Photodesmus katoptron Akat1 TaxID=1236703 RepID=S3EI05_9GAMM|nr:YeaH/YhbH family protein [Candidatus Photodesmus katoptron]EPE37793.1 UPF0229 protein VP0986 protein [Candidatus Photodesmus katoptron Akat1]KEY90486.1 hypothetical protein CF66_2162 [Candidatus Photodesmus katoptron]
MVQIIDRRLNTKNKSAINRQRFLRRHKKQIKESLNEAVNRRSITNIDSCENISIPHRDITEPIFQQGQGGIQEKVNPGNDKFVFGDKIQRPKNQSNQENNNNLSNKKKDQFVFQISKDEYLDLLFNNLELPNLEEKPNNKINKWEIRRSGFQTSGIPFNIAITHSLKQSFARRIAMTASKKNKIKKLKNELDRIKKSGSKRQTLKEKSLKKEISLLQNKIKKIPFIDTLDLRFKHYEKQPVLSSQAVIFCLMDVSGSMNQITKDIAKRFYLLLYLFLTRTYESVELVFIRHHTQAKEVDEYDFFYSQETGGTIVSSALKLMMTILQDQDRYPEKEWNIYAAQVSDGDNWAEDSPRCKELLIKKILPRCQYYSYIEITKRSYQTLWNEYKKLERITSNFSMKNIKNIDDVFPTFRELFQKK